MNPGRPLLINPTARATVHQADCLTYLASLPDNSVDLTVTDPAYESLEVHRARGTTTRLSQSDGSSTEWFPVFPDRQLPDLMEQLYRVLKAPSHCYIFCDEDTSELLKASGRRAGFWFWGRITWVKTVQDWPKGLGPNSTPADWMAEVLDPKREPPVPRAASKLTRAGMGYHWRKSTEYILFFEKRTRGQDWPWSSGTKPKGKGRRLSNLAWPNVMYGPRAGKGAFPTEKPGHIVRRLILNSSEEDEVVLDPFCGSGVVGVESVASGRRAQVCDKWSRAVDETRTRLGAALGDNQRG